MGLVPGLVKGLVVTGSTVVRTVFPKRGVRTLVPAPSKGAATVQYPHVKEAPPPRARGVIALHEGNCTACMLCARECPDWCIYIEGHKEKAPPRRAGGKPRQVNILDRFDIDYALCMFCGICVDVCPFEALFWSPEYEFSEPPHRRHAARQGAADGVDGDGARLRGLRGRVGGQETQGAAHMNTAGVLAAGAAGGDLFVAQNVFFGAIALVMIVSAIRCVTTRNVVHAALWLGAGAGRRGGPVHPAGLGVRGRHPGARLHRRHRRAVPVRDHAHEGLDGRRRSGVGREAAHGRSCSCCCSRW